jgi:hypothetical protein
MGEVRRRRYVDDGPSQRSAPAQPRQAVAAQPARLSGAASRGKPRRCGESPPSLPDKHHQQPQQAGSRAISAPAILERATFRTSRLLDFASEKELVAQAGHQKNTWRLVILKELVDNAIDACEEAAVAPVITVTVDDLGTLAQSSGARSIATCPKSPRPFNGRGTT